jgi:nucleotide-binding universal stress UspA family protein
MKLNKALDAMELPEGYALERYVSSQPSSDSKFAMKWDGEWHITYEVFRDLGIAFAIVLILIYILVVGWFQSFKTPLTIMAAIPFSLVGILPAHAAMGAFFTATSMIGFIAGAGIVVRNSIILVDFIELRLKQGMPLEEAVIDAGAVRFRPMMLTAAAVIVGAGVILFDPIFQGLAISLMAGEVASLLLSRVTVPVLYYLSERNTSILKASETSAAELIVMGTHGRSGVTRMMMGSVAERVLHETRIPLLTVRDGHAPGMRRIVCPINFTEPAAAALKHAASIARMFDAKLMVLHVIEGAALADEDLQHRAVEWARQECSIAEVETFVLRGNAAEQVIEYARSNSIDLIVLGAETPSFLRHQRSGVDRRSCTGSSRRGRPPRAPGGRGRCPDSGPS